MRADREGEGRAATLTAVVRLLPEWQLAVLRFNDRIADRLGIAGSDLQCLFALDRGGPSTPGALAARVGLTTGSASRMIERLVVAGLVVREPDPTDRRRVVVSIRAAASQDLHALYDPLDEELGELLAGLDDDGLRQLERFVEDAVRITMDRDLAH